MNACLLSLFLHLPELVLKVRIQNPHARENDFIEVELDRQELTYRALLRVCCRELDISAEHVEKIRKLPNTMLRKVCMRFLFWLGFKAFKTQMLALMASERMDETEQFRGCLIQILALFISSQLTVQTLVSWLFGVLFLLLVSVCQDKDVARLQDFQELEVVLEKAESLSLFSGPGGLNDRPCYNMKASRLTY